MKEKNLEDAISYFRKYTVYTKVFAAMRKKYAARGQFCGTLTLEKLTGEERSTLSGFTGVDLGKEETVQFSFLALNRALKKSRFHELEWEEILEGYDRKPLVSNKEEKQRREEAKDGFKEECLAYGVSGRKPDGSVHEGLHGFCTEKQAFQVTLNTLGSLSCLEAAKSSKKVVYVLENPAVFSYLTKKYPGYAFLCTAGQIKLAGYVAMDLFPEENVFYYAGDFDPEGLQIAQKLKKRYGKRLFFWNYKREYYERAMSGAVMDAPRLNKLEKVETAELDEIKECLLTHKRAAYQERMMDWYIVE